MKFSSPSKAIPAITLSLVALLSTPAHARISAEELCFKSIAQDVEMKQRMTTDSGFFEFALEQVSALNIPENQKPALRERFYFAKNRLHLTDTEFKRLAFAKCLYEH